MYKSYEVYATIFGGQELSQESDNWLWSHPWWSTKAAAHDTWKGWSLDGWNALVNRTSNYYFAATTFNCFNAARTELKRSIGYFEIMEAK